MEFILLFSTLSARQEILRKGPIDCIVLSTQFVLNLSTPEDRKAKSASAGFRFKHKNRRNAAKHFH